jgi:hypothetical protein
MHAPDLHVDLEELQRHGQLVHHSQVKARY